MLLETPTSLYTWAILKAGKLRLEMSTERPSTKTSKRNLHLCQLSCSINENNQQFTFSWKVCVQKSSDYFFLSFKDFWEKKGPVICSKNHNHPTEQRKQQYLASVAAAEVIPVAANAPACIYPLGAAVVSTSTSNFKQCLHVRQQIKSSVWHVAGGARLSLT